MSSASEGSTGERFPDILATVPTQVPHTPEAGLHVSELYRRKLPPWRYFLRKKLLPLIRWETPYLASIQHRMRTPALDLYFAITANLGTHTFFMIVLPILFWCGYTSVGRGMVRILATGVFVTGFLKDMLSLPRPLSPPLHRITMSESAVLEYGFPSTHSANAVSVAVYALFTLHSPDCELQDWTKLLLESLSYFYAISIVLGRLYCGMHGFIDVVVGSMIGAAISVIECVYGGDLDHYLHNSSWLSPLAIALIIIALIKIHPEPADDCPCFDDSVAFAGVLIGIELGGWHYAIGSYAWDLPVPATVPFDLHEMGWTKAIIRVVLGVGVIYIWKETMKPAMLKILPHVFRVIETYGLIFPRKFFKPASEYESIPSRLRVDNVMPSVSDLPSLFASIRHPGRGRSISVGPQSAADAYETLACRERRHLDSREKRRRDNLDNDSASSGTSISSDSVSRNSRSLDRSDAFARTSGVSESSGLDYLPIPLSSRMMSRGRFSVTPPAAACHTAFSPPKKLHLEDKDIFQRLTKPRVRYDVEVVTKLVVYTGIAWFAVEINPIIFEETGLGMTHAQIPVFKPVLDMIEFGRVTALQVWWP